MKLKDVAVSDLRRELARRESGATKLQATRAAISKQLAALEAELADLGMDAAPARRGRKPGRPKGSTNKPGKVGRPKGSNGKRAKNSMSLVDAILKGVPTGKTVSPAEAAVAAKKVGYKTTSPNFGMMVANALSKDSRFKRLGRGQYQVGGGKLAAPKGKKAAKGKVGRKPKSAAAASAAA